MEYKLSHFGEVLTQLSEKITQFANENSKLKRIKSTELDVNEIQEIIRSMPQYEELMKLYTLHLDLCQEAFKKFNKNSIKDHIDIEQNILTGVDKYGRPLPNSAIISDLTTICKKLTPENHARLLIQYLSTYELNEKDRYNIITSLNSEVYKQALENVNLVNSDIVEGVKLQRREPVISEAQFSYYKKKQDSSKYAITRHRPKLSQIVIDAAN